MIPSPLGHAQSPWLLALHTVGTVGISVVEEGGGDGDGDGDGGDGGDGDGGNGDGDGGDGVDVPSAAANIASVKVHLVSVHTCASGPMLLASSAEHCSNARAALPFLPFWNGMHFVTKAVSQPELQAVVAVGTVRRPRFFKHGRVVQSFSAAAGATAKVASNARSAIRMVGVAGMMLVVWSTCKVQQKYWVGRGFEEDSVRV